MNAYTSIHPTNGAPAAAGTTPLGRALRRCRGAIVTVAVFSFFINLLVLAGPLYMLQVYDRVLASGRVETLILLTVILAGAVLAWAMLESLRTAVTVRVGGWLTQSLGPFFLQSGLMARLAGRPAGGQLFRDLNQIQSFIATQGMNAIFDLPWTPMFIAVIWLLHPWLGMLALAATLALVALSIVNEAVTRGPLKEMTGKQMAAMGFAESALAQADAVRALGMTPAIVDRWRAGNVEAQVDMLTSSRRNLVLTGAVKFVRMFSQSAILGLGAYLVLLGQATAGVMIAASILLGRALAPVDVAINAWKSFTNTRLAYGRLREQAEAFPAPPVRMLMPEPRGGLAVEGLSQLGAGGPVLRAVSFAAAPGEVVAVIGPSAAGKSTLCKCLVGLAPPLGGRVRLDGLDIALWDPDQLGRHVGYLGQEVGLLPGTIRENIARMSSGTDAAVLEAAELAHAHDMICRLPQGYETTIGEGGLGLSGGQKQRIGLARALYGRPSLIVLDEPNANLDQSGEAALAAAILELKECGATLVIVGHRPSTLAQADKVLLLQDGIVQAFGPRAEVLQRMREAAEAQRLAQERSRPPQEDAARSAPERAEAD